MKTRLFYLMVVTVIVVMVGCAANSEGIATWRAAAEQGDVVAQYLLGLAYDTGEGVERDPREAMRWYRKAAEQGDAEAQYNLGLAYDIGEGVERDPREAMRWYRKAAEQGDAEAQYNLGLAYDAGEGVERDPREAMRWYRKAAEQGHAWAEAKLRDEQNRVAAEQAKNKLAAGIAKWRAAAERGEAVAQYSLGYSYATGKGVEQDPREAVRWYRKAAEQGHAWAQNNLGNLLYEGGEGVAQDPREAVHWWRKAAAQGDAKAQYALGMAYKLGEGVIADVFEAYIWLSIAKANGNESAADFLRKHSRSFDARSNIRALRKQAAQRMEAIENREKKPASKPALSENIAIAPIPQRTNIATHVFEQTWRSVVVVLNGDSQGSGVIIRPNIVATNCHVVNEGSDITVYKAHNRRANTDTAYPATIRHADANRDFCLLDVVGLWGVPVTVRRYDTLNVGEDVYALGAPKGLDLSLSDGLVSQLRTRDGNRVIQTNAEISFGSSGGGLFDSEGNLVGIVTAKLIDKDIEGIAFAIPADLTLEH